MREKSCFDSGRPMIYKGSGRFSLEKPRCGVKILPARSVFHSCKPLPIKGWILFLLEKRGFRPSRGTAAEAAC
ncbi:hypothetical protein [Oryzisolibacter propanilivorax]|uniref:hypothetical protein n=1 Tax=Oryzisolibacter propanilivorax TaxID=1527607 RepID=UPI001114122A|nr:hypothetical protein [Oryzisolibacter propanilivorax]